MPTNGLIMSLPLLTDLTEETGQHDTAEWVSSSEVASKFDQEGLYFDGASHIRIPSLANFDWGGRLTVSFLFKRTWTQGYMGMVGNGFHTEGTFEIRGVDVRACTGGGGGMRGCTRARGQCGMWKTMHSSWCHGQGLPRTTDLRCQRFPTDPFKVWVCFPSVLMHTFCTSAPTRHLSPALDVLSACPAGFFPCERTRTPPVPQLLAVADQPLSLNRWNAGGYRPFHRFTTSHHRSSPLLSVGNRFLSTPMTFRFPFSCSPAKERPAPTRWRPCHGLCGPSCLAHVHIFH